MVAAMVVEIAKGMAVVMEVSVGNGSQDMGAEGGERDRDGCGDGGSDSGREHGRGDGGGRRVAVEKTMAVMVAVMVMEKVAQVMVGKVVEMALE